MKAIIASDSPKINDFFAIYFIEDGIEPTKAKSTAEILARLDKEEQDILIIDIDSDRYEGLETIKTVKAKKDIVVIVLTSQTGVEFVRKINELGVFSLISKIDEMNSQIENIFSSIDVLKKRRDEKRKHIRMQPSPSQHNMFSLKIRGLDSDYQGQVKDISRGGVALTFSNPPPESLLFTGKDVLMNIELGPINLEVKGNVVARMNMEATILFVDLSDANKRKVYEYILGRLDEE